jgi:dihydrofolate synthase/folylpolyglutamate synthase
VLGEAAVGARTTISFVSGEFGDGPVGLMGAHQRGNAAVARAAVAASGLGVGDEVIVEGMAAVRWPGRFERIGERLVLDGAHNPQAARALVETWREVFGGEKGTVIFGTVESKDVAGMVKALGEIASQIVLVTVGTGRGVAAGELAAVVAEELSDTICLEATLEEALRLGGEGRVLVTGSLFLVGECVGLLEGGKFEVSLQ